MEGAGKSLKVKAPYDHFGNSMAICLGDFGMYLSWEVSLSSGFDPKTLIEVSKIYSKHIKRLTLGQSVDVMISGIGNAKEKDNFKGIIEQIRRIHGASTYDFGRGFRGMQKWKKIKSN